MRKSIRTAICSALVLAVMQTSSCAILPQEEVLPDAPIMLQDDADEFDMTYVRRGDLVKTQRYSVTFRAVRQEKLSFAMDGLRIDEVHVKEGDTVKAGQLLMELEQGELSQEGEDALDQCASLELQLKQAIETRELSRDAYELQLRYMDEEELEEADTMEEYLRDQERAIEKLENQLTVARKEAETVEDSIAKRQMRAGIDGVATYVRAVRPNDLSSVREIMVILSDTESSMFVVETKTPERFPAGMEVEVIMNQNPYPCKVISAEDAGALGEDEVYLKPEIPTAELAGGDTGYLMLEVERCDDVLYVEQSAIKTMDGQAFVYMVDENGMRVIHPIQVGNSLNGYTEILGGLSEGDQVILR